MAVTTKLVRVANPRRSRGRGKFRLRTARRKKNASRGRRKMSDKQIRHFGTPAQKAALKRKYRARFKKSSGSSRKNGSRRRNARSSASPRVKVIYRYKNAVKRRARRRRSNPALVVTLGSVNPKRRTSVARTRKRRTRRTRRAAHNPRRRRHHNTRRRRNTRRTRVVVMHAPRRRRRHNAGHRRRRRHNARYNRRRNPFMGGGRDMLKAGVGILVGVTATKLIPKYIPASIASSIGSGSIMAIAISGVSAWLTGFIVGKWDAKVGEYAMYGGIAQTISVALNAFLPQVGSTFSLGDLVNGNFVVPQNPIRAGMMGMAPSAPAARGMAAYSPAY